LLQFSFTFNHYDYITTITCLYFKTYIYNYSNKEVPLKRIYTKRKEVLQAKETSQKQAKETSQKQAKETSQKQAKET
jgi:hypothetical protein